MKKNSGQLLSSKKGLIGAGLVAIAASACCVGPLVLLAFGIGGVWVGNLTAMEPFRPYLIGITIAFLGYAFYSVYRRPKMKDCEPDSYCANPKSDRINKTSLWIVTLLVVGLLAIPYLTPVLLANENNTVEVNTHTREVVLDVLGMTCASCSVTIQKSLARVDGVIEASASFDNKNATVKYDPTKISTRDIIKATRNAGYESTIH